MFGSNLHSLQWEKLFSLQLETCAYCYHNYYFINNSLSIYRPQNARNDPARGRAPLPRCGWVFFLLRLVCEGICALFSFFFWLAVCTRAMPALLIPSSPSPYIFPFKHLHHPQYNESTTDLLSPVHCPQRCKSNPRSTTTPGHTWRTCRTCRHRGWRGLSRYLVRDILLVLLKHAFGLPWGWEFISLGWRLFS
jgi:hypothetical protein